MAEVITAIGLAASVVQLIDIGSRVVSKAWKIHELGEPSSHELADAQKTSDSLQRLLRNAEASKSSDVAANDDEKFFKALGVDCRILGDEIVQLVGKTRVSGNGGKRSAVKSAVVTMRKKEQIDALQSRLDRIKQDLILHLLDLIRRQAQQTVSQQHKLLEEVKSLHLSNKNWGRGNGSPKLDDVGIGVVVLNALEMHLEYTNPAYKSKGSMFQIPQSLPLKRDLVAAMHEKSIIGQNNDNYETELPVYRRRFLESTFLKRLKYSSMGDREARIPKAHAKTFGWIFEDEARQDCRWSNFNQWLKSDSQLYWITGKAGSGKSTLMKYICQEYITSMSSDQTTPKSRCEELLQEWADCSKLIVATFYFWNSGDPDQMSQRGLLVSLLSQILNQMPELIPAVCPNEWEVLCLFGETPEDFSDQRLEAMLRSIPGVRGENAKFCLFVDGLDEFEGQHIDLVNLFKDLINNVNVKVCVSSRPWIVFEDSLRHRPSLMLQDLTFSDIKDYVSDQMTSDIGFALLQESDPDYAQGLIENIVSKASGVFLWVTLVVRSLLAGMRQGDRLSDLQIQLDQLPPDLEKLYDKIFMSLDPLYLKHAAQLFRLVEACPTPPSLLLLSFADEEKPAFALKRPFLPIEASEEENRAEVMRRRLKSRCKGLLEADIGRHWEHPGDAPVQYLHKTVREYIMSHEANKTLDSALDDSFDPHCDLLKGSLVNLKCTKPWLWKFHEWASALEHFVDPCLFHAVRVRKEHASDLILLLDDMNGVCEMLARRFPEYEIFNPVEPDLMLKAKEGKWVPLMTHTRPRLTSAFLPLCIRYGILHYVSAKVTLGGMAQAADGNQIPLLEVALAVDSGMRVTENLHGGHTNFITKFSEPYPFEGTELIASTTESSPASSALSPTRRIEFVALLLQKGADPNLIRHDMEWDKRTIWIKTLKNILVEYNGEHLEHPWLKIAELMIRYGASLRKNILHEMIRLPISHYSGSQEDHIRNSKALYKELKDIGKRIGCGGPSRSILSRWRRE